MQEKGKKFRVIFYAVWVLLLLLQAWFTQLIDDEAYYWVYSRHLNIGYFDHPPMIALAIKAGYAMFPNAFGVRLFPVLFSFFSLLCIEKLLVKKDFLLFATLVSAILITQVGGILAVPDSPYVFFLALFFVQLKNYEEKNGYLRAALLGLCMAGILYSKYHGAMLLFFIVIFYWQVWKRPSFYLALLVALVAYLPHLVWLVKNDYPSFYYHFGERNVPSYTPMFTVNYILGQLVVFGPLTGIFIFYALFRYKPGSRFEKVLKRSSIGVLAFLFLFSFKGTVEANWTLCLVLPLVVLTHQYLVNHARVKKIFYYSAPVSILLLLLFRVFMVYDFTGGALHLNISFHHQKTWTDAVHKKAGDLPVVFINSYQKAAVYNFYTGETSISLNNIRYRMNQYNLLGEEDSLQGKKVLVIPNWPAYEADSFSVAGKVFYYKTIDRFSSFSKIFFSGKESFIQIQPHEKFSLPLHVGMRYTGHIIFTENPSFPSEITYHFFKKRDLISQGNTGIRISPELLGKDTVLTIEAPAEPGSYDLRISVTTGWLPPAFNSKKWTIKNGD